MSNKLREAPAERAEFEKWYLTQPHFTLGTPGCEGIAWPAWQAARAVLAEPINMVLHCPKCGRQHIDAREGPIIHRDSGSTMDWVWDNPPHRSHLCRGCEHIWRPADVPTNGVTAIKTKGKNDSPPPTGKTSEPATRDAKTFRAEIEDALARINSRLGTNHDDLEQAIDAICGAAQAAGPANSDQELWPPVQIVKKRLLEIMTRSKDVDSRHLAGEALQYMEQVHTALAATAARPARVLTDEQAERIVAALDTTIEALATPAQPLSDEQIVDLTEKAYGNELAYHEYKEDIAFARSVIAASSPLTDIDALSLAIMFHHHYERLAPSKGYDTRVETRVFDPESPNGKLMVATCESVLAALATRSGR